MGIVLRSSGAASLAYAEARGNLDVLALAAHAICDEVDHSKRLSVKWSCPPFRKMSATPHEIKTSVVAKQ